MFSVPTRSPRLVDEHSFLAQRIPIDRTLWIEEIRFDFFDFSSLPLSHFTVCKIGINGRDPLLKKDIFSFYTLDTWLTCHMSALAWVPFCPETIYFVLVQVQIILYELSLNYFTTSKIFFKNLIFWVHHTPVIPKNMKI